MECLFVIAIFIPDVWIEFSPYNARKLWEGFEMKLPDTLYEKCQDTNTQNSKTCFYFRKVFLQFFFFLKKNLTWHDNLIGGWAIIDGNGGVGAQGMVNEGKEKMDS